MVALGSLLFASIFGSLMAAPFTWAASVALTGTPSSPIPPSIDPFYTIKFEEYCEKAPGIILRIRQAPGNLTTAVTNSSAAYNILFRTTDANDEPSYAVTTLFIPSHNKSSTANPSSAFLLSHQIAYNTANVDASPSYALYSMPSTADLGIPSIVDDFAVELGKGWYLNVPDFEGPHASFGLGAQAGHATLDSVRAVLSSGLLPREVPVKYAMWGYSGGSIASQWAAELQKSYAPEMSFAGVALGGIAPDLISTVDNITGSPYAGLIPSLLLGSTSQDPDARAYLKSRLHETGPYNATAFLATLKYNAMQAFAAFANQDIFDYLVGGRADIDAPILQRILKRNWYWGVRGVPQMPVFAYKAIHDQLSKVQDADALVEKWCEAGVNLRYERNTVGGHIAEITNGRGRAMDWLESIFEGTAEVKGCVVQDVTIKLTDNTE